MCVLQHSSSHPRWSKPKSPSWSSPTPRSEWCRFPALCSLLPAYCTTCLMARKFRGERRGVGGVGGWKDVSIVENDFGLWILFCIFGSINGSLAFCIVTEKTCEKCCVMLFFRNIECDLNINNGVGIRNTHLLKYYCLCKFPCCCPNIKSSDTKSLCTVEIDRGRMTQTGIWFQIKIWNRIMPRVLVQNQQTGELISTQNT